MRIRDFGQVWVIDFEYKSDPGELPVIHCLVARELRSSKVERWRADELFQMSEPPFPTDSSTLIVGYYLPAEYGCFLQLGWHRPVHSLDLCFEFKRLKAGLPKRGGTLVDALLFHGLHNAIPPDKAEWRELAIRGGPFTSEQWEGLLNYCQQDVDATAALLRAMEPARDLPRAILRGRYAWAVAQVERNGVPMDVHILARLREGWDGLKGKLISSVDRHGIYVDGSFKEERFSRFLQAQGIPWPKLPSGRLALDDDTFRQQAKICRSIAPYHELRASLSRLKLNDLAIGRDGRNRTMLSPFGSTTGRNQPSNTRFIFGPAAWIRGLIQPPPGRALAYVDWSQQELGIAAALSKDPRMMGAYNSGDPYLAFARMAGAVPDGATKKTHPQERAAYKICMLAVQYGMGAASLAARMGGIPLLGRRLLQAHRDTFPAYWAWSDRVQDNGFGVGRLETRFGWCRRVTGDASPASVRNFPVQANGAEMLRLALMRMLDQGVKVVAPVHDAVMIEAAEAEIEETIRTAQDAMQWASEQVLEGFRLSSDYKTTIHPSRYMDEERGLEMWDIVMELLGLPQYSKAEGT